jgi:hypothetical protein
MRIIPRFIENLIEDVSFIFWEKRKYFVIHVPDCWQVSEDYFEQVDDSKYYAEGATECVREWCRNNLSGVYAIRPFTSYIKLEVARRSDAVLVTMAKDTIIPEREQIV